MHLPRVMTRLWFLLDGSTMHAASILIYLIACRVCVTRERCGNIHHSTAEINTFFFLSDRTHKSLCVADLLLMGVVYSERTQVHCYCSFLPPSFLILVVDV